MTKRQAIENFRKRLQEQGADSTYTNQFLYNSLIEQAKWLIKREIAAGRIYRNNSFFQTLGCIEIIETSTIDPCCPVKTNCKIYRTKHKLPEMWIDTLGPIVRSITSVDGTTDFFYTDPITWQSKRNNPYQRMVNTMYSFPADGYLWIPEHNPHFINVVGGFTDDISELEVKNCSKDCPPEEKPCVRFLDTKFVLPDWLEAEMYAKALQLMIPTKQMQPDNQIDKNETRRN